MFRLEDLKTIFQTFTSILKWRDDKKAMKRYEELLSDQENSPACEPVAKKESALIPVQ
ncbi:MAG: hypothetical protein UBAL2_80490419 [Leptospirillum rubarum]|uniref:Uncharacterized protein n=1 Tax=Leptospirillum sp. Group II '5-way CG' TaxID=419541 RepID=B6AS83_9BACT|nr:MAG: hypothetical protein UBAL2_80490419 [Leptospirillum rubarum]EDZ38299.1 MAG: Hypothetical protein CGL2_11278005 [Leptospirillum sp. Group II '5-way CG']